MKHLALALSVLSFSNFSNSGHHDSSAHGVQTTKTKIQDKKASVESSTEKGVHKVKSQGATKAAEVSKQKQKAVPIGDIKEKNAQKVRDRTKEAKARAEKPVEAL